MFHHLCSVLLSPFTTAISLKTTLSFYLVGHAHDSGIIEYQLNEMQVDEKERSMVSCSIEMIYVVSLWLFVVVAFLRPLVTAFGVVRNL